MSQILWNDESNMVLYYAELMQQILFIFTLRALNKGWLFYYRMSIGEKT